MTCSTQGRVRSLAYPELRERINAYIVGILSNMECPSLQVGAVIDHMHVLYIQNRTRTVSDVIATVKKETSRWIKEQMPEIKDPYLMKFAWQTGYAAFSVSESNVKSVKEYIAKQEDHHHRMTFQEEYRKLLEKHHIEYDEKYVWD